MEKQIKLTQLSQNELANRQMNVLMGGASPGSGSSTVAGSCSCICSSDPPSASADGCKKAWDTGCSTT